MESVSISSQVNVSHCSQCQGDTEYYCLECDHNLCPPCKKSHVISLDTKHHDAMLYRVKFNSISNSETCVHEMYYKLCDLFYIAHVLQTVVKRNVTTHQKKIVDLQSAMLERSQILKDSMDIVLSEISVKYKCLLIHKLHEQMMKMERYLNMMHIYEQRYEQMAYRPVEFLRFIKKSRLPQIQDTPHFTQQYRLLLTQGINTDALIQLLSEPKITEGRKRKLPPRNKLLLKLRSSPEIIVDFCDHIPCVTLDLVWVSEKDNNLILTDTTIGDILCSVKDSLNLWDIQTVNCECNVIYIDKKQKINQLSRNMKTTIAFIKKPNSRWKPLCVYCSLFKGGLLFGMWRPYTDTDEVRWYNKIWKLIQTKLNNNTPDTLYMSYVDNTLTFCVGSYGNTGSSLFKYLDSYRDRKDTSVNKFTRGQTENEGGHSTLRDESDKETIENEDEKNNDTHTRINGSLDDSLALPLLRKSFSTDEYHGSDLSYVSSSDDNTASLNSYSDRDFDREDEYHGSDLSYVSTSDDNTTSLNSYSDRHLHCEFFRSGSDITCFSPGGNTIPFHCYNCFPFRTLDSRDTSFNNSTRRQTENEGGHSTLQDETIESNRTIASMYTDVNNETTIFQDFGYGNPFLNNVD